MYRRLAASALAVTLTAAGLVAAGAGPAVAVTNPWSGTVVNHSSGTNDPAPVVLEDSTSKLTTDSVITWSYDMTWTPIAGQATSSDPFNTDMPATATGAISYREEHTTDFEYKPAAGS